MRIAIIFRAQTEEKSGDDEKDDALFSWGKNDSLPDAIQFEAPASVLQCVECCVFQ